MSTDFNINNPNAPAQLNARQAMNVTELPDAWKPDPADGYNPGPELRATHDGITLTVQRTHLHDTLAVYYWQITVEGHSIPMADGTFSCSSMAPPHAAAAEIAWQLYAGPRARTLTKSPDPLTWWNGAVTPHAAATIGIMFREAWT